MNNMIRDKMDMNGMDVPYERESKIDLNEIEIFNDEWEYFLKEYAPENDMVMYSAVTSGYLEPQSYKQMLRRSPEERLKWEEAVQEEFGNFLQRGVFVRIFKRDVPEGRKLIDSRWVFKVKRDGRFRARLVARGFTQVPGIDYKDNFSPVCNDVTLRMMLIIWLILVLDQGQMDVETAFLEGCLPEHETIYMKVPEGMEGQLSEEECLEIKKGMYGLVQASRLYFLRFTKYMKELGFQQCPSDQCLFFKWGKNGGVTTTWSKS